MKISDIFSRVILVCAITLTLSSFLYAGDFDGKIWYPNQKISHVRPNNNVVYFQVAGHNDLMYIINTHPIFNAMVSSLLQAQTLGCYIDFHTTTNDNGTDYHSVDALDVHIQ